MAIGHSDKVYDILTLNARPGQLDIVLQDLHDFVSRTEEAAVAARMEPALDHFFYHVRGEPDEAVVLAPWRSQAHHDDLVKHPAFEPALHFLVENVLPNLTAPPEPCFVPLSAEQVCAVGNDADRFDVPVLDLIEITLAKEADRTAPARALESALVGKERQDSNFLGWFYGYKDPEQRRLVVGLRWALEQGDLQDGVYDEVTASLKELGKVSKRQVLDRMS